MGTSADSTSPCRGEVWRVRLDPTIGHEQAGTRPALVISVDQFNRSRAGLVFVVPITTTERAVRSHVPIAEGEGGLLKPSFAKAEDTKSISKERLIHRLGRVRPQTLAAIEDRLRVLLGL